MGRLPHCPLCGSPELGMLFEIENHRVERCAGCSLVLLNPQPQDDALYAEGYYRGRAPAGERGGDNVLEPGRIARRLESCRGVLEEIEEELGRKGRLLDLGCGPGFLLKAAEDAGWTVRGGDVSAFATAYAREHFGIRDIRTGPLEAMEFDSESFDVVTLQHVIEHFRDPVRMAARINGWLAPGGLLWIETPDIESGRALRHGARWEHFKVPEHLFYFNERTLRRLLGVAGFEVVSAHREVEGTGLLTAACGGSEGARRFYERFRQHTVFRMLVRTVRSANEFYRARLRGESDVLRVLARKVARAVPP